MTTLNNPESILSRVPKQRDCSNPAFLAGVNERFLEHLSYVRTAVEYDAPKANRWEIQKGISDIATGTAIESAEAECSGNCQQCPRFLRYGEGNSRLLDLLRSYGLEVVVSLPKESDG